MAKEVQAEYAGSGIAFFVIGLFFVLAALYSARPSRADPIVLEGEVADDVKGPVTVILRPEPWQSRSFQNGKIMFRFYPDVSILTLEASAPGYEPTAIPIEISSGAQVQVGRLELRKRLDEIRPTVAIRPLEFEAPPVTDTTNAFGTPR
jgi:hypothetical protein